MIALLICVTLIVLEVVLAVFWYFKDKNNKEYDEYCNCLSDIIEDISYHTNLIKDNEVYGDAKVHIKNIKRLCDKIKNENENTIPVEETE